jgi:hypothetical protein
MRSRPLGYLAVRMQDAQRTSAGAVLPGQVVALPDPEARELIRKSVAREVRVVPPAGQ